jgi:hypothetical protein
MVERIYDTIKALIFHELPKNANGFAVVFDRPILGWYFGDRDIKPSNLSIILNNTSSQIKDVGLGIQEFTYTVSISIDAGTDNVENSERLALEANRLILQALRKHRRMWVMELCPICSKLPLIPTHYTLDHSTIFSTYVTTAQNNFNVLWADSHSNAFATPTLPASGLATEAFSLVYDAVKNNSAVTNLTTSSRNNIKQLQADMCEPIRMLYDVQISDAKPSDDSRGQALLKSGTLTLTAKEIVKITSFGPDNVPTTAA